MDRFLTQDNWSVGDIIEADKVFYEIVSITKSGAPRVDRVITKHVNEFSHPLQWSADIQLTDERRGAPFAIRWSKKEECYLIKGNVAFRYDPNYTYSESTYN